ncbi:nSTAND1 domain-containing NTPase [Streptomyces anulatus]|uniref:nSTAND1 domain-containing NTPase n=1 Tax=Streptomyces anulatus TaxID=1892 RepID=UPI0036498F56
MHRDKSTVVLFGPSGCGKSSLARASVVPRMRADGYEPVVVNASASDYLVSAPATDLFEAARRGHYGEKRAESRDEVAGWLANEGLISTLDNLNRRFQVQ